MNENKYFTKYELRWTLIYILTVFTLAIAEYELGVGIIHLLDVKLFTFLAFVLTALIYLMYLYDKKTRRKMRMNYRRGVKSCSVLTLFIFIAVIPTSFLIYKVIMPDFFDDVLNEVVKNNLMSMSEAKETYNTNSYLFRVPLQTLLFGGICTFAMPYFVRKRRS